MSLADILAAHSRDIQARIQHQNDADNEVAVRKATTLEEKFQHAKDAIEGVGAELGAAGATFHMGRKIYTKFKQRQARLGKQQSTAGEGENSETTTPDSARAQASESGTAPKQGGDDSITEDDSFFPDRTTGNAEADNIFRDDPGNLQLKARQAAEAEAPAEAPTAPAEDPLPDEAFGKQAKRFFKRKAQREAQGQEESQPESTTNPETTTPDSGATNVAEQAENVGDAQASAPTGTEEANPLATRQGTALQESPDARPANVSESNGDNPANAATEQRGGSGTGTESEGGTQVADEAERPTGASNSVDGGAGNVDDGINGAKSLANDASQGLEDAGKQVGKKLGSGLSDVLPEVGEALDFLGPIGEFAGLITGLVGVFEGLGHKQDKPQQQTGTTGDIAPETAGAGLDTKALTSVAAKATPTLF